MNVCFSARRWKLICGNAQQGILSNDLCALCDDGKDDNTIADFYANPALDSTTTRRTATTPTRWTTCRWWHNTS